ncbi:MAG: hypothetical protein NTY09_13430 [bacterium]|nr:hypothetical protein [bacterium]
MTLIKFSIFTALLVFFTLSTHPVHASDSATPALGLSPDPGFPAWLTEDVDNYIPLTSNQTSGLDWIASGIDPSGYSRHWFIICDDAFEGGIHLISVLDVPGRPEIHFHRAGKIDFLPGYIDNVTTFQPPGWDAAFGQLFTENQGIEGCALSEDRLFLGLESPFDFATRIGNEKSTVLGIWSIDPTDPTNMENCAPLKIIDTSDWEPVLGCKIETISGLDAVDSYHLVGIDRDNQLLFAVEFDENYNLMSGRIFFLDCPGPMPSESDNCTPLDHLPILMKPTLESVAVVPIYAPDSDFICEYQVYLACDPWAPGWVLNEPDWNCDSYEQKLFDLLPAIYRYTVPADVLFP